MIFKNLKDVYILNCGEIIKIFNNFFSVIIKNLGNINIISGSEELLISGKKFIINDIDKDEDKKVCGLYFKVEFCIFVLKDYVRIIILIKLESLKYKIYYRVVDEKLFVKYVGEKISIKGWSMVIILN